MTRLLLTLALVVCLPSLARAAPITLHEVTFQTSLLLTHYTFGAIVDDDGGLAYGTVGDIIGRTRNIAGSDALVYNRDGNRGITHDVSGDATADWFDVSSLSVAFGEWDAYAASTAFFQLVFSPVYDNADVLTVTFHNEWETFYTDSYALLMDLAVIDAVWDFQHKAPEVRDRIEQVATPLRADRRYALTLFTNSGANGDMTGGAVRVSGLTVPGVVPVPVSVPEPATLALVGVGLISVIAGRRGSCRLRRADRAACK